MSDTLLQSTSFASLPNWSVQYLLQNISSYNDKYNLVHIGDFLTRNKTAITLEDEQIYKRVTIKINNGGVYVRDTEKGLNIGTKKQFVVNTGQFLLSKIDARNGAFGVVPQEVDNAIITGNFWTFDVDYAQINPHFLALMTTTPEFIIFCNNASNGTTNRHYLQEDLFLEQKIPLPTLDEQNRLINSYNLKISQAVQQEGQALELEQSIEEYLFSKLGIEKSVEEKKQFFRTISFEEIERWSVDTLGKVAKIADRFKGHYELIAFKQLINLCQYGLSEKAHTAKTGYPMLRMNNILNAELITHDLKYISISEQDFKKFQLNKGDLLFNRTNSKELVGKTAIFDLDSKDFTFASYLIRVEINDEIASKEYVNYLFNSSILQYQKDLVSRQVTGQANINAQEMQTFLFPLPPLPVQQEIANHVSDVKDRIRNLKDAAQKNRQTAISDFEKEIFKA